MYMQMSVYMFQYMCECICVLVSVIRAHIPSFWNCYGLFLRIRGTVSVPWPRAIFESSDTVPLSRPCLRPHSSFEATGRRQEEDIGKSQGVSTHWCALGSAGLKKRQRPVPPSLCTMVKIVPYSEDSSAG